MKKIIVIFIISTVTNTFASDVFEKEVSLVEEGLNTGDNAEIHKFDDRKLFAGIKDHMVDKFDRFQNKPHLIDYRPTIGQLNSEISRLSQQIRDLAALAGTSNVLPAAQSVCNTLIAGVTLTTLGTGRYFFSDTTMNWHAAQEFCIANGMQLVSLETQAENDLVKAEVARRFPGAVNPNQMHWIGLNDLGNTNTYIWTALGIQATYSDYVLPNPTGFSFHCVGLIQSITANNVKWEDANCDTKIARFICELPDPCLNLLNP